MKTTVTLLILLNLLSLNTFAQDYTQWGLPEGAKARLGKGRISGNIAYSPDSTRLAVGSSLGIWLYDTTTYQEVALLTGHTGSVSSVAFSPDGNTLASATCGMSTQAKTPAPSPGIKPFSPDGNTLASGGGYQDNTVRLWEVDTGVNTHTLTGHTGEVYSVAFSPDGNTIASYQDIRCAVGGDTANTHTLTGHTWGKRSVQSRWKHTLEVDRCGDTGANTRTLTGHNSVLAWRS